MTTSNIKVKYNMKLKIFAVAMIITAAISCSSKPAAIPVGTWNYDLLVNGIKAGSAVISNSASGNNYIIKSEMYIKIGTIENSSVQIITETKDFKPVKLEVLNTVTDTATNKKQVIEKSATFSGSEVTLKNDGYQTKFTIDGVFVLDGNYFFNELLKKKFEPGTVISAKIYEPSVEIDEPILVIVEAKGFADIQSQGRMVKLFHIKQRIEKFKSIDVYVNEKGITEKMVMKMLNNIFELVRRE